MTRTLFFTEILRRVVLLRMTGGGVSFVASRPHHGKTALRQNDARAPFTIFPINIKTPAEDRPGECEQKIYFWQWGQNTLLLPPSTMRASGAPQSGQGLPPLPYTCKKGVLR